MPKKLLIIDDEENVRYSIKFVLEDEGIEVLEAGTAEEGLALFRDARPDVVLLDLQLPDGDGFGVFREIQEHDQKRPVIFITAHGTADTAIEAMKQGAFDYLIKPVELERLNQLLQRAFEAAHLMQVPALLPIEDEDDRIIGRSSITQEMCKAIGRIAPQEVNTLIVGESGVGKELVARALYHHSRRADRPFLAINCAAIPDTLLESEMFGHEQGAFTGAQRRRIGKLEQCDGGTLFLDEIGDMAPALQAKILRVLQEQRFERLGGSQTVATNVRIIAATNQDLNRLVADGRFRKDLFYRLNIVTIQVPPLRERPGDVAELAHYFLFRFNRQFGKDLRAIPPETLAILEGFDWPGNVRELEGAIQHACLNAAGHLLLPEFLPGYLTGQTGVAVTPQATDAGLPALVEQVLAENPTNVHAAVLDRVERVLFQRVLQLTDGNQTLAAERLGLSRSTLRVRLRSLGLSIDRVVSEAETE